MVSRLSDIQNLHPICTQLTVVKAASPPTPQIFNWCWGPTLGTGSCPIPTEMPAVKAGTTFTIKADIANSGNAGRVNAIFKIDNVAIYNDTNINLGTFPGGGMWSPSFQYTMPTKNVSLIIETYGWDGTKWVINHTKSATISTSAAGCTGIDLVPFSASIDVGGKVDLIANVTPGNVPFTVTLKDRAGTILGTCKTSGMGTVLGGSTCPFTWDSNVLGKTAGTYYVKAYTDSCMSTEAVISVAAPIRQWNFVIKVVNSVTGALVSGATVLASTVGGASQSKVTDVNGVASFRLDEGTINVSISNNGYNTFNTAEYLFLDRSITYSITPIPPTPTVGDIEFVSVPTGADVYLDGKPTTVKTPIKLTGLTAGSHTWELRLTGYNNSSGSIIVPSGGTASVYTTLSLLTPTAGSLNITSHPMGAEIYIDGKDYGMTTSGSSVVTAIPPGNHTYTLTMMGFQDKTGTFNIVAGQTTYLDVELVPLTTIGILEIDSQPSGARIYINDKDTSYNTPATITNLAAGEYNYKVSLTGHKDVSGKFIIESEKTTTVHLILEKAGIGLEVWAGVAIAAVAVLSYVKGKKE